MSTTRGRGATGFVIVGAVVCLASIGCGGASSSTAGRDGDGPSTAPTGSQEAAPATVGGMPKELVDLVVSLDVGNPGLVDAAGQVVKSGNAEAVKLAGDQLAKVGKRVGRAEWRTEKRGEIESGLRQRGAVPSAADIDLAAVDAQTEAMRPLFDAMGVVGGAAVATFAFAEATDATLPMERRRMAVNVAAKHLPASDPRAAQVSTLQKDLEAKASALTTMQSMDKAPAVMQELAPKLKRCFVDYMKTAPPGAGFKGTLDVTLAADGSVASAKLRQSPPEKLGTCVEDAAKKARFDPPAAGKASLKIPLDFTQQ